ncbi:MAG: hypothetical protein ACYDBY_21570 [Thermoanaerobaculia bacterium]
MVDDWRALIRERQELRVDASFPTCWLVEERTPAHRFTFILFERESGLFVVAIRDEFRGQDALGLIEAFRTCGNFSGVEAPIVVLDNVSHYHDRFDSIGILRADAHGLFPRLAEKGIRLCSVFPMARCEFSGDEPLAMVKAMRRDFVCTLDWTRAIAPKILMGVSNSRTKVKSRGKGRVLVALSSLQREVGLLEAASGSWLEIENYEHKVLSLRTGADSEILAKLESKEWTTTSRDLVDFVTGFVTHGSRPTDYVSRRRQM